jgi:hypothetical protein
MDFANLKPSDKVTLLDKLVPVSQGVATVTTGWILASAFNGIMALIAAGVLGAAATLDAKFQQATDSGGSGAKDVVGAAITQMVKATDDNKFSFINLDPQKLDVINNFNYIRLSLTVGVAASLIYAAVFGLTPRYGVAAHGTGFKEAVNVN